MKIALNNKIGIDTPKLMGSRLLVQANSGGGKSWLLRRILEQSHKQKQQIVIDPEGEFSTLREKYDYVLVAKGGDVPADPKTAGLLAHKLLEMNVSAIIDLYELLPDQRKLFVKNFLDAMVNAPKKLWHDCLVILDEAHTFAPEKGDSVALDSVIALATLGRKRGYCLIPATQRLSKLHKDVAAECNNKLIGRTNLDIDIKRAGEELGFTSKEDLQSFRRLDAGEFYAYGTAISGEVIKVKVGDVETTHPTSGGKISKKVTPPTARIKKVLGALADLPEEARQELKTQEDLRGEIRRLQGELRIAKQGTKVDEGAIDRAVRATEKSMGEEYAKERNGLAAQVRSLTKILRDIGKAAAPFIDDTVTVSAAPIQIKTPAPARTPNVARNILKDMPAPRLGSEVARAVANMDDTDDKPLTGGTLRMITVLVSRSPMRFTRSQLATFSKMKPSSGSYGTYLSTLRSKGLIDETDGLISASEKALSEYAHVASGETEDVIEMWRKNLRGGTLRMFEALVAAYPEGYTREDLGQYTDLNPTSGSFGTYLSMLRTNGLIEEGGGVIRLNNNLI